MLVLTLFLAGFLAFSLLLNKFLADKYKECYSKRNETRLDPLGLEYYPHLPDRETPDQAGQVRTVFFGDSRAEEWPAPVLQGYEFINRGIDRQTTVQVLWRLPYHLEPLKPGLVLLQVGINDLKTIGLFPRQKSTIIANCKENIRQIVARSVSLGATVILSTIFPTGEVPPERRPFWSDDIPLAVDEVNLYLNSLAGEKIIILDAFSILADKTGLIRREYSRDELHLTPEGYENLNRELVRLLASLNP